MPVTAATASAVSERSRRYGARSSVTGGRLRYFHQSPRMIQGVRCTNSASSPIMAIERSNSFSMPLMTVNMEVTDTMPMTMPSVVSSARAFCCHSARPAMRTPSAISVRRAGTGVGGWRGGYGAAQSGLRSLRRAGVSHPSIGPSRWAASPHLGTLPETPAPMSKLSVLSQLWQFLRIRKKYWLLPIVLVLVLLGVLVVSVSGSPLAPFVYALF